MGFSATWSPSGSASGDPNPSAGCTFGEAWTYTTTPLLVYCDIENARGNGAGRWYLVDSNAVAPVYISHFVGFVKETSAGNGSTGTIYIGGLVSGFTGLSAGLPIWAYTTAGGITQTEPAYPASGAQNAVAKIGFAISDTEVLMLPQIEIEFQARNNALANGSTLTVQHCADTGAIERETRALALLPATPDSGLKVWLKLDDNSGVTATDSSGNGNNGTLSGGAAWDAAVKPTLQVANTSSVHLDGVNGIITLPDVFDLSTAGDKITFACWVKFDAVNKAQWITSKYYYVAPDPIDLGWYFGLTAANKLSFVIMNPAGANETWVSTDAFADTGSWHHIAFSYTTGTGTSLTFYYDGVAKGGSWTAGNGNTPTSNTARPIVLGCMQWAAGSQDFVDGKIDEVRIYNRILSATEVDNLFDGYNEDGSTVYSPYDTALRIGSWAADTSGVVTKTGDVFGATPNTQTTFKNLYSTTYDVVASVTI